MTAQMPASGFAAKAYAFLILCVLAWWGWTASLAASGPAHQSGSHHSRILAQPKAGVSARTIKSFHARHHARKVRAFPGLQNLQVLEIAPGNTVDSALQKYQRSGLFEFVEADSMVRLSAGPNDPFFLDGTLWGLRNLGQEGGLAGADIRALEGWAIRHCASNIVVAVIDSGVRYTHQDLSSNMWRHPVTGAHGINAVAGTDDPDDDNGHGTLVAGILGASGNNGIGVTGVAWNVQIMACKFADRFGDGTLADAIQCLEYARTNGAHIINVSWGIEEFSQSLSNAVKKAGEQGIMVVAAAGNRTSDTDVYPYYPASLSLDNVVSVAATTRNDQLHFLSNYGENSVHLGAPGEEIHSTHHRSDEAYATRFGTSMAAAYVSGALALLHAHFPGEGHPQLIQRLLQGTDPLPALAGKCASGGRLNLFEALDTGAATVLRLTARLSPDGQEFELEVLGEAGKSYSVEGAGDFQSWTPVVTGQAGPDGSFRFTTALPEKGAAQFFRAMRAEP
jgi:subtilisin family serine protease